PRSHWDMLLERRTIPELEELLEERLAFVRSRRGAGDDVTVDKLSA
ncbi:RNA polymerase-binding protein RbpA, partial [Microbacterium sp.]